MTGPPATPPTADLLVTAPFEDDRRLSGQIAFDLDATVSGPDTTVAVDVRLVPPEGDPAASGSLLPDGDDARNVQATSAWMRAYYRDSVSARGQSTPPGGRPRAGGDRAVDLRLATDRSGGAGRAAAGVPVLAGRRALAAQTGGDVTLRSIPGRGIRIPLADADRRATPAARARCAYRAGCGRERCGERRRPPQPATRGGPMSRRTPTVAVATAIALLLPGAALAHEGSIKGAATDAVLATAEQGQGSENMSFITNLEFPEVVDGGSFRATDMDFHSYPVGGGGGGQEGRALPPQGRERMPAQARDRVAPPDQDADQATSDTRDYAFVGTALNGLHVVDITDREDPQLVARYDCRISQADVFVFEQEDRVLAAYSLDAVSQNQPVEESDCHADNDLVGDDTRGTFLVDITDPLAPQSVSFLPMRKGTHQITVHPSGDYVYNSAAVLVTTSPGTIEVYDIGADATPEEPELVDEIELLTGLDSHDLTFNEDGTRLYSAAITHSFIIDTSDPTDNQIVGRIYDPAINIHHDAHAVTVDTVYGERDFMFIGDELGGATATGVCPGGGVHVYDITGPFEQAPVKVGAFFIPEVDIEPGLRCTAHVLDIQRDEQLISIAWYGAGVRILDYSGLKQLGPQGLSVGVSPFFGGSLTSGITEIGHFRFPDSDLWSAKVPEVEQDGSFYIYGGDIQRTFDVFRFDAEAPRQADAGSWLRGTRASLPADAPGPQLGGSDSWKQLLSVGR